MAEGKNQDDARTHKEPSDFAQSSKAEGAPKAVRKALDGAEADAMRHATQDAKRRDRGGDPQPKR